MKKVLSMILVFTMLFTFGIIAFADVHVEDRAGPECECGTTMRTVTGRKNELAPCGHWSYWDGYLCGDCGNEYRKITYLRCSCGN